MEAGSFISKMMQVLNITGSSIPFGPLERRKTMTSLYNEARWFGLSGYFITFATCDHDSITALKIILSNNKGQHIKDLNISYSDLPIYERAKLLNSNPVVAVDMFRRMFDAFIDLLCDSDITKDVPPLSKLKKTTPLSERRIGIIGRIIYYRFIFECDARATMHTHGQVNVSHMSPVLLERIAAYPKLVKEMSKTIDSHVLAELPLWVHINGAYQRQLGLPNPRYGLKENQMSERLSTICHRHNDTSCFHINEFRLKFDDVQLPDLEDNDVKSFYYHLHFLKQMILKNL